MGASVHVHMCLYLQNPEENLRCHSISAMLFFLFETGFLTALECASEAGLAGQRGLQECTCLYLPNNGLTTKSQLLKWGS